MKLTDIKRAYERIEQGDWIKDIPEMPGLALRVKGIGNLAFDHARQELIRKRPHAEKVARLDAAEEYAELGKLLADTVLIDWSGLQDDDGVEMPYSKVRAEALLTDPEMRAFQNAVQYAALMVATPASGPAA
ncbi:MAG: hypothetical protein WDM84_08040 [Bauldia sp.]